MIVAGISGLIVEMFNPNNWNVTINGKEIDTNNNNNNNNDNTNNNGTLVEDVIIRGHSCLGSTCNVSIEKSNNTTDYKLSVNNSELFIKLGNYSDYIKVNIYYTQEENEKTIVNYKIYNKYTNEDISSASNENELRDRIGLYSIGTHTESLKLTKIGIPGIGNENDTSYTYINYTFVDNKNNEYEMQYKNPDSSLNLIEGNSYTVTFEVVEGTFDYEFNIKSIK